MAERGGCHTVCIQLEYMHRIGQRREERKDYTEENSGILSLETMGEKLQDVDE